MGEKCWYCQAPKKKKGVYLWRRHDRRHVDRDQSTAPVNRAPRASARPPVERYHSLMGIVDRLIDRINERLIAFTRERLQTRYLLVTAQSKRRLLCSNEFGAAVVGSAGVRTGTLG